MAAGKAEASNADVKAAAEEVKAAAIVAKTARVLAQLAETHAGAGTGAGLLLAASLLEEALCDVAAAKSNADAASVPAAAAAQVAEPTLPPPLPSFWMSGHKSSTLSAPSSIKWARRSEYSRHS